MTHVDYEPELEDEEKEDDPGIVIDPDNLDESARRLYEEETQRDLGPDIRFGIGGFEEDPEDLLYS